MKQFAYSISLFLLLTGIAIAQPSLSIANNQFSFGAVPQNATITQYFWFKSTGTDTLKIQDVKTGCDCATMPLEKTSLPPGDSMLVGLHWNTKRQVGDISRNPYIMTNARTEPYRIYLNAQATAKPDSALPLSAFPYALSLTKTSTSMLDSIDFRLINRSEHDIAVRIVSQIPEQIVLQIPQTIKAKSVATGSVRVKPEFTDREFSESITLLSDDTKESRITIPITRKISSLATK